MIWLEELEELKQALILNQLHYKDEESDVKDKNTKTNKKKK